MTLKLFRCIYDKDQQYLLATRAISDYLCFFNSDIDYLNTHHLSTYFRSGITFLSSMLKHPDFSEEKEWRLASVYGNFNLATDVRRKAGRQVPYVTLPIQGCIKEIMIGPSRRQKYFETKLHNVMHNNALTDIKMNKSLTPYRG